MAASLLCSLAFSVACSTDGDAGADEIAGGSSGSGGAGGSSGINDDGTGGEADPLDQPPTGARYSGVVEGPHADDKASLFPVPGALVAAHREKPAAFPDRAYCAECVDLPPGVWHAISKADGSFVLELPPGETFFLTTEKGQPDHRKGPVPTHS